ncbi:MAG: putative restriction endonuclease [Moraxellaceae bacterium]|jgi:predicted restriction endonuclease|nr:putative restriction endonuclease [Moraxellaceae bacterium]
MANWNREQLLVALNLYCQLPFGKFHQGTPLIIETAKRIGRTPSALAMKLSNLASLDPAITQSGRKGLPSTSSLDRAIWEEFQKNPDALAYESQKIVDALADQDAALSPLSSKSEVEDSPASYYAGTTTATITLRVKQGFFRKAILSSYENRCCMTGLSHPALLIASHIVPWSKDEHNRLNPANGLCLSALHDKAFDRGLITVSPDFIIRISQSLRDIEPNPMTHDYLLGLEGKPITQPHKFAPHRDFLSYHSSEIFLG